MTTMRMTTLLLSSLLILTATAEDEESTPLGKKMSSLNDTMKLIKRENDPSKAAALSREAQDALLGAFHHAPAILSGMPEGPKKQQAIAKYRRMLSETLSILCKMEEALLSGKTELAETLRKSAHDLKLEAHEQFIEQE